jgi:hypothetical protein
MRPFDRWGLYLAGAANVRGPEHFNERASVSIERRRAGDCARLEAAARWFEPPRQVVEIREG